MRMLCTLAAALAWTAHLCAGPAEAKKPNIVFVFSDDHRADTIAALGNKHIQTPVLDRLVRGGTAFTRAYCMGGEQGAVCVPSRAMMLTGRSLFRVDSAVKNQITWPEILAKMGYVTFATGKWHNGQASAMRCFQLGRSVFFGGMGNPHNLPIAAFGDEGGKLRNLGPAPKHSVEEFTDRAVDFIRSRKGKKDPFVAYVSLNLPHDPRTAPKKYHALYEKNPPPAPPNFLPEHPFDNGELKVRDEKLAPWPRTEKIVRSHLADYYACITFVDAQVGRLLQALEETGQLENTIVVFAGDHGLAIGSHGLFGKQNLYDHSMRTPMILAGPGIPKGKTSDALVYLFDLAPTFCAFAGAKIPTAMEGRNLVPLMQGADLKGREAILVAYRNVQRAALDDRWHLIEYPKAGRTQLFDLRNDPHEVRDLAADAAHQAETRRMLTLLRRLQQEYSDPLLKK